MQQCNSSSTDDLFDSVNRIFHGLPIVTFSCYNLCKCDAHPIGIRYYIGTYPTYIILYTTLLSDRNNGHHLLSAIGGKIKFIYINCMYCIIEYYIIK